MLQYDQATNRIKFPEERKVVRRFKLICSDNKFGPQNKRKYSFVSVRGERANDSNVWVAKVLLLLKSQTSRYRRAWNITV